MQLDTARYTHYARMSGIPIFLNPETGDVAGRNWFYDLLVQYYAIPLQFSIQIAAGIFDPTYASVGFEFNVGNAIEECNTKQIRLMDTIHTSLIIATIILIIAWIML